MKKSQALYFLRKKLRDQLLRYGPNGNIDGHFWNRKVGYTSDLEKSAYELYRELEKSESKDDDDIDKNSDIRLFHIELREKSNESVDIQLSFIKEEIVRMEQEYKNAKDTKNEMILLMLFEESLITKDLAKVNKFLTENKINLKPEIWHLIAEKGTPELAELFLKYHQQESKSAEDNPLLTAKIPPKDNTPIFSAVKYQNLTMFNYLRKLGAHVSQKNAKEETLLHTLCESIRPDPADAKTELAILNELTLTYSGITDELNANKETALIIAMKAGRYTLTRELILNSPTSYYIKDARSVVRTLYELEVFDDYVKATQGILLLLVLDERRVPSEQLSLSRQKEKVFLGDEDNELTDQGRLEKILQDAIQPIFNLNYGDNFDEKTCYDTLHQWDEDVCRAMLTYTHKTIAFLNTILRQGEIHGKRMSHLEKDFLPMLHLRLNEFNQKKESLTNTPQALLSAILAGDEKNIQRALQDMKTEEINSTITDARKIAFGMMPRIFAPEMKTLDINTYYRGMIFLINQTLDKEGLTPEIFNFLFYMPSPDRKDSSRLPMSFCIKGLAHAADASESYYMGLVPEKFKAAYEQKSKDSVPMDACLPFIKEILTKAALNGDETCVTYVCSYFKNNPAVNLHHIAGEVLENYSKKTEESRQYYQEKGNYADRRRCLDILTSIATISDQLMETMPAATLPESIRPVITAEIRSRISILADDAKFQSIKTHLNQTIQANLSTVKKVLNSIYQDQVELKEHKEKKSKEPETACEKLWELIKIRRKESSIIKSTNINASAQCLIIFHNFINALAEKKVRDAVTILLAGINIISQDPTSQNLFLPSFMAILNLPPNTKDIMQALYMRLPEIMDSLPLQYQKFKSFLDTNAEDQKLFKEVSEKTKMKSTKESGMWDTEKKKAVAVETAPAKKAGKDKKV